METVQELPKPEQNIQSGESEGIEPVKIETSEDLSEYAVGKATEIHSIGRQTIEAGEKLAVDTVKNLGGSTEEAAGAKLAIQGTNREITELTEDAKKGIEKVPGIGSGILKKMGKFSRGVLLLKLLSGEVDDVVADEKIRAGMPERPKAQQEQVLANGPEDRKKVILFSENREAESSLSKQLEDKGYAQVEIDKLLNFFKEIGIPEAEISETLTNINPESDLLMTLETLGVAYDAAYHQKLPPESREDFIQGAYSTLKQGRYKVKPLTKEQLTAMAGRSNVGAAYHNKENTFYSPSIALGDLDAQSIVVHELVHAVQDDQGEIEKQKRLSDDQEFEAWAVQYEYKLRSEGLISDGENGTTKFSRFDILKDIKSGDPNAMATESSFKSYIIFQNGLRNAELGRVDLNTFTSGGIDFSKISREDSLIYFQDMLKNERELLKTLYRMTDNFSSGFRSHEGDYVINDGLDASSEKPGSKSK